MRNVRPTYVRTNVHEVRTRPKSTIHPYDLITLDDDNTRHLQQTNKQTTTIKTQTSCVSSFVLLQAPPNQDKRPKSNKSQHQQQRTINPSITKTTWESETPSHLVCNNKQTNYFVFVWVYERHVSLVNFLPTSVCVCVCVKEREREKKTRTVLWTFKKENDPSILCHTQKNRHVSFDLSQLFCTIVIYHYYNKWNGLWESSSSLLFVI